MFETLQAQPADSLLGLIKVFNADGRAGKIDLGVGVYRDAMGVTPVLKAVKEAEKILLKSQDSKKYLGPEGDAGFAERLQPYVFGNSEAIAGRIAALQTPGGTGALRLGAELIRRASPRAAVRLGAPTWPNHAPIFAAAGLKIETSRFADLESQTIDVDGVWETLDRAKEGDVVLLHGCCHNPTGMNFSRDLWQAIVEILVTRRLVPFIDLAYQGLGDGLEEDAWATRLVLDNVEEALVAYSCDKNFGLYRDRVGALFVMSRDRDETATVMSNLAAHARVNWSMPPDHGAAVVRIILERPKLVQLWREELDAMRARINGNRKALAAADPALAFVRDQRGLFSNLAMSKPQAVGLRERHAIYCTDSGRINLAGMQPADADAIVSALRAEGCLPTPAKAA